MKIKRILRYLLIIGLAIFAINLYKPSLFNDVRSAFDKKLRNSRVLGVATNNKQLNNIVESAVDFVTSLPIVQDTYEKANTEVNKQIENLTEKSQSEAENIKKEVKDTVCEEWLK